MTHKPSDYGHAYGERPPSHWAGGSAGDTGRSAEEPQAVEPRELATFRLLYESEHICVFETREGHLSAVDVNRLA